MTIIIGSVVFAGILYTLNHFGALDRFCVEFQER